MSDISISKSSSFAMYIKYVLVRNHFVGTLYDRAGQSGMYIKGSQGMVLTLIERPYIWQFMDTSKRRCLGT